MSQEEMKTMAMRATINMDSVLTQMTPQFPTRGVARVNINVAKRTPSVTLTEKESCYPEIRS